jgi:hypothetical protein
VGNDARITGAQTAANVVAAIAAGNPGSFSTLAASGVTTLAGSLFGSVTGSGPSDLSKHLSLFGSTMGLGITSARLNYVVASAQSHFFRVAGVDVASITSTGINAAAIGATTASTGSFSTVSASGQITSTLATGTAPFTVASTTVVANLNVAQLAGATWVAPGTIGSTTPNTGKFSTLAATGLISPTSTIGVAGTVTNDAAQAGSVGEYVTATVATSAISLTSGAAANITSISLTAGDWDVNGAVGFLPAGTTVPSGVSVSISLTSATLALIGDPGRSSIIATMATGAGQAHCCGPVRVPLATTTTVYLVATGTFTVSTMTAGGTIRARRMR